MADEPEYVFVPGWGAFPVAAKPEKPPESQRRFVKGMRYVPHFVSDTHKMDARA